MTKTIKTNETASSSVGSQTTKRAKRERKVQAAAANDQVASFSRKPSARAGAEVADVQTAEAERAEIAERKRERVSKLASGQPVAPVAAPDAKLVKELLRATPDQRISLAKELGVKVVGKTREQSAKIIATALSGKQAPAWLSALVSGTEPASASAEKATKGTLSETLSSVLADLRSPISIKALADKLGVTEAKARGFIDALRAKLGKGSVVAKGGGVFVAAAA